MAAPLGNAAEVELRLAIPEAPFHVIGDPVPLRWEFMNRGDQTTGLHVGGLLPVKRPRHRIAWPTHPSL